MLHIPGYSPIRATVQSTYPHWSEYPGNSTLPWPHTWMDLLMKLLLLEMIEKRTGSEFQSIMFFSSFCTYHQPDSNQEVIPKTWIFRSNERAFEEIIHEWFCRINPRNDAVISSQTWPINVPALYEFLTCHENFRFLVDVHPNFVNICSQYFSVSILTKSLHFSISLDMDMKWLNKKPIKNI